MNEAIEKAAGISIGEGSIALIAAITLVVTAIILLIGFRISGDFHSISKRLSDLENKIQDRDEQLRSLRTTSAILARLHQESYALHEITRRAVISFIGTLGKRRNSSSNIGEIYDKVTAISLGELARTALYIRLLDPQGDAHVGAVLDELVGKFPDKDTMYFLSGIYPLMAEPGASSAKRAVEELSDRVYGIDLARLSL